MKKYYSVFYFLVLITSIGLAYAQLEIGLKAGVNVASQKGTDLDYANSHAPRKMEDIFTQKGLKVDRKETLSHTYIATPFLLN